VADSSQQQDNETIDVRTTIAAVTVFPDQARVTRRGHTTLGPGEHRLRLDNLQAALLPDSIRVSGTGAGSVLGVEHGHRYPARTPDETVRALEDAVRAARARQGALTDEDAVAALRLEFYQRLAQRSARSFAAGLAEGRVDGQRVAEVTGTLGEQHAATLARRRELEARREDAQREVEAAQRELAARRPGAGQPVQSITVTVEIPAGSSDVDLELDVSYVALNASWSSTYDLRLAGTTLALSWYGLVTQHTGEDWPECDLRLSTARPSGAASVPELDPWFLDRLRPMVMSLAASGPAAAYGRALAAQPAELSDGILAEQVSTVEQGPTAATYQPTRPVAVPSDGTSHRATVAVAQFEAALDYLTAPVRAAEAYLRATVTNSSPHTLPGGRASVFHAGDFVGSSQLEIWAPGEEVELALGVDDRVRVERELVRRSASKPMLGGARRRDAEHRIRVTNHTPAAATVTVLDQLPVSRDEAITVKEQRIDPAPTDRTDLGVLTWVLQLGPGETRDVHIGVRVETAKGVELAGWRE
jgi:uncharacterized protein (TIGR02231 family)